MNSNINASIKKCNVKLSGEQTLASNISEGLIKDLITGGLEVHKWIVSTREVIQGEESGFCGKGRGSLTYLNDTYFKGAIVSELRETCLEQVAGHVSLSKCERAAGFLEFVFLQLGRAVSHGYAKA